MESAGTKTAVGFERLPARRVDSYGEVIDRFGLRLAAEPPYLLTSQLDTFVDPPRSSAP